MLQIIVVRPWVDLGYFSLCQQGGSEIYFAIWSYMTIFLVVYFDSHCADLKCVIFEVIGWHYSFSNYILTCIVKRIRFLGIRNAKVDIILRLSSKLSCH